MKEHRITELELEEKIKICLDFIQAQCDEAVCYLDSDEKHSASYQIGKIYSTCQAFLDEHIEENEEENPYEH